jgi:lipoate-protein ligase A
MKTNIEGSGFRVQDSLAAPTEISKSPNLQISKSIILNPSSFILLIDPPASGAWNMAVDEVLLESADAEGECTLRFYQWQEPTLSLGYFQTYTDRLRHAPSSRSAVVRRSSGGGAILHDHELTYSFAVPNAHPLAADRLGFYRAVHLALIAVLADWGIEATLYEPPSPPMLLPEGEGRRLPFLCFERRSPGDVLVTGAKIAGSAQRRSRGAVLQHGSVLLARSNAAPELDGLKELTNKSIKPQSMIEKWLAVLTQSTPDVVQKSLLSPLQHNRAAVLAREKYASADWTENRRLQKDL